MIDIDTRESLKKRISDSLEEGIYLTHIYPEPVPQSGLRPLAYLTKKPGEDNYYYTLDLWKEVSKETVKRNVEGGSVMELQPPIRLNYGQIPWIDEKGNLYLATINDPFHDDKNVIGLQLREPLPAYLLEPRE